MFTKCIVPLAFGWLSSVHARSVPRAGDGHPSFPYHSTASVHCSVWYDNDGSMSCKDLLNSKGISMKDFVRWNPSVGESCLEFSQFFSYCIEANDELQARNFDAFAAALSENTALDNDIIKLHSVQTGVVANCNKFYFVEKGDSCNDLIAKNNIQPQDFHAWNPSIGEDCTDLWSNAYVCVGVFPASLLKPRSQKECLDKVHDGVETHAQMCSDKGCVEGSIDLMDEACHHDQRFPELKRIKVADA